MRKKVYGLMLMLKVLHEEICVLMRMMDKDSEETDKYISESQEFVADIWNTFF